MTLAELKNIVDTAVKDCGGKEAATDIPLITNEDEAVGNFFIYGVYCNGRKSAYLEMESY